MDDPFGKSPEDVDVLIAAWFLVVLVFLCVELWFYHVWKAAVEKW